MKRFRIRLSWGDSWQFTSTVVLFTACLGLLLFAGLQSLLPGYSKSELVSWQASHSLHSIWENPVNAPYKLTVLSINKLIDNPLLSTRLASAAFGFVAVVIFYWCMRHWYQKRVAFLGTLLFATSNWLLHAARHGTPDILYVLAPLLLVYAAYRIAEANSGYFAKYLLATLALSFALFVPGMWIFIVLGLVLRYKDIFALRNRLRTWQISVVSSVSIIAIALPLGIVASRGATPLKQLMGLPQDTLDATTMLQNLIHIPSSLFVRSNANPEWYLGHLPFLGIFTTIIFALGCYYFYKKRQLARSRLLAAYSVIAIGMSSLQGNVPSTYLLPLVYIVAAAGLLILLGQWLTVFPKNPFAKAVGVILVAAVVGLACVYNLRAYFVAWPHAPATKYHYSIISKS